MPEGFLLRSVQKLLGADTQLVAAAYVWQRRDRAVLIGAIAAVVTYFVASTMTDSSAARIGVAVALGAACIALFTNYWVLAATPDELVRLRGSRIRKVARAIDERSELPVVCRQEADAMVVATWRVIDEEYSVPRSSQKAMQAIALVADPDAA